MSGKLLTKTQTGAKSGTKNAKPGTTDNARAVHLGRLALVVSLGVAAAILGGCGSMPKNGSDTASSRGKPGKNGALPRAGSGRGGYYLDDGPGDDTPDGLENTPDAVPRVEPYARTGNKPYVVFGQTYTPMLDERPFTQRGRGSWYGRKFHRQRTSSGEPYDMFQMSAAHPTLPIPSYARVTNLANGKQVIVRVNDRGPFLSERVIDLSYTAALKLGYVGQGSAELQIERLLPDEIARINSARSDTQLAGQAAPVSVAAPVITASAINGQPAVRTAAATSVSASSMPSSASPPSLPSSSQPWVSNQSGEGAQVEVYGAVTPVVETSTLPAQIVALPAAVPAPLPASLPPSAPAAQAQASSAAGGVYLQFGAFSQAANADAARERLNRNWNGALPAPQVVQNGALYRVYSGPFNSRQDADLAARQIEGAGVGKPVIVLR